MEEYLNYVLTTAVVAIAIVLNDINATLTTVILLLTIVYWIQRNYKEYRDRKLNKQPVTDKSPSTKEND